MSLQAGQRVKRGIYVLAGLLIVALGILRYMEIDRTIFRALAATSGLLVIMLLLTYRAFAGVAEAARNGTLETKFGPPPPDNEDER